MLCCVRCDAVLCVLCCPHQVAEALAYLHSQGVPHGDLRLHNMYFTSPEVHETDVRHTLSHIVTHCHTLSHTIARGHKIAHGVVRVGACARPHVCMSSTPVTSTCASFGKQLCMQNGLYVHHTVLCATILMRRGSFVVPVAGGDLQSMHVVAGATVMRM